MIVDLKFGVPIFLTFMNMLWAEMQVNQARRHQLQLLHGMFRLCECFPACLFTRLIRFNRLVWGYTDNARPLGILAAGMENGELGLWDAEKILSGAEYDTFI